MFQKYFTNLDSFVSIILFYMKKRKYPFFIIILLLFITSFIESVGLITLIPLFEIILMQNSNINSENFLSNFILKFFDILNVDTNINSFIIFIILIFILKFIFILFTYNFISFVSANMQSEFQRELIFKSFDSKWDFFNQKPLGILSNTIGFETKIIANMFQRVCSVFTGILQSLLVFFITVSIDGLYSIVALLIALIIFFLFNFLTKIAKKIGQIQSSAQQNLLMKYSDILQGLKSFKASDKVSYIKQYILRHILDLKKSNFNLNFYKYLQNFSKEPVVIVIICIFIITNYNSNLISYNQLIIFIILLYRILISINMVQLNYTNILAQYGYFVSVNNQLNEFSKFLEKTEINKKDNKINFNKSIEVKNINFSHNNKEIFNNLNFKIEKNTITMIHGDSGAGKTTLIDILVGLYKPNKGEILIDGNSILNINLRNWRKNIEYVQQEMFLINDTIRENITFGNQKITDNEIWDVLEKIDAKNFVSKLEKKLNNVVGERGSLLSGGQRQRISLTRAIVNKPKILILDEITASLDKDNEKKIFNYLYELKNNMTIIYITHQVELSKYADQNIFLNKS